MGRGGPRLGPGPPRPRALPASPQPRAGGAQTIELRTGSFLWPGPPGTSSAISTARGGEGRRPGGPGTPRRRSGEPGDRHTPLSCLSVPAPGPASQVGSFPAGQLPMESECPPCRKGEVRRRGSCSSIPHPAQTRGRKRRCLFTPGTRPAPSSPLHGTPGRSGSLHSLRSAPISPRPGHRSHPPPAPGLGRTDGGGLHGVWGLLHACTHCPKPDVAPCPCCHRTSPQSPVNTAPTALGRGSWRGLSPPRGHYWWGGGGTGWGPQICYNFFCRKH